MNPLSIQASLEGSRNKYLIIVVTIGYYDSAMLFETSIAKRFQRLSSCTLNARFRGSQFGMQALMATNGEQPQCVPRQRLFVTDTQ